MDNFTLTLSDIKAAVCKIAPNYPIKRVELYGSYALGTANSESDVDVLVEFKARPITLLDFCGFQQELSEALNIDVDILKMPLSDNAKNDMEITKVVSLYG